MNDKQMAALFMSQLLPAIQATAGLSAVKLKRSFQPRQHGADSSPYVYFVKIGDHRYGSTARKDTYTITPGEFTHTETQRYESTYQFSAWAPQDPAATTALTESDILSAVSDIMQSDAILAAFQSAGVGVLRVTDVRNPYIVDDRDQFEAVPSFDVVLTHERKRVSTVPAVVTYEATIIRV